MDNPAARPLRICALYPELLNIYADRGNMMVLQRRCEWRGIEFELSSASFGEELDPDQYDLFYLGGGQDRDQKLCADDLVKTKRSALHAAANRGAVIFGVCGGYQLLGEYYELDGECLPGLELVDLITVSKPGKRLIGNVAIEVELDDKKQILAGFENHGGRTHLGPKAKPLGRVLKGKGNNGKDHNEGVRGGAHDTVIGTYLHGPLLPKNTWFADWLIKRSLGVEKLGQLDDTLEQAAHRAASRAAGIG